MDHLAEIDFKPFTVAELTAQIKTVLENEIPPCWVEGELSNVTYATSGHVYCTLKDANAQIRCAIWRSSVRNIPFRLEAGQKVIVFGSVQVYEPRGEYQLIIEKVISAGLGILQLQLEALKKRLYEEGLFDPARKKELPPFPKRIAIVTSPTGAAIEDMLRIFHQQWQLTEIILAGVKVQGEGSAEEIAEAIKTINLYCGSDAPESRKVDVIIVARGGGSLEDLWSFNEEIVVRAIADSKIPTVSAVGHEIDFSLSDFAADVRAPTPTAAAQLVVPVKINILEYLEGFKQTIKNAVVQKMKFEREKLMNLSKRSGFTRPLDRVYLLFQRIDEFDRRSRIAMMSMINSLKSNLENLYLRIQAVNPLKLLARGFAIVYDENAKIVSSLSKVYLDATYRVQLSDGTFQVICKDKESVKNE